MAPKVLSGRGYTITFDIWAVAATVIELAGGKPFLASFVEMYESILISSKGDIFSLATQLTKKMPDYRGEFSVKSCI